MLRARQLARTSRWYSTTATGTTNKYKIGQKVAGFTVGDIHTIPRLDLTAVELRHHDTGARHLHVDRDDDNNVFSIGFKTNPPDHTGVPHILEHTTLCGSHKYPVKDPFFSMLTRSLSNFMNAMTGLDYTFYPFATTNQTDFKNLQQVYLDSVYNPLLREADFRQEGWRLERENPKDENSKIIFKGVVYNEMKGMTSDPSYLFNEKFLQRVYPSLNSSGGDPQYITDLKYEELKNFHDTRYHPSNAFTYSYGKMPLEEILTPIQDLIKGVKKLKLNQSILQPKEISEDTALEVNGPIDPLFDASRQNKASLSWVVANTSDMDDVVVWRVLSLLLIHGHSSPLYKALIDSGLGSDFSANTGFLDLPGKSMFSVGLQGLSEKDIETFKTKTVEVLQDVARNGVPKEHLDAIINLVELSQREVEANYGLGLVSKLMPRVFNGDKTFDIIDEEKMLERFKKLVKESPKLFQEKVEKLLSSPKFEFVMKPDQEYEAKVLQEEEERLQRTIEQNVDYDPVEETPKGDESVLPMLTTGEIAVKKPRIDVERFNNLYVRETGTQGLTYVSMLKNLGNVPAHLRPLLPLFASAMTNMGTETTPMDELENKIRLTTGGIDSSLHLRSEPTDMDKFSLHLNLAGSSLDAKSFHLYDFFNQFLTQVDYQKSVEKLRQLIQASAANAMGELSQSGNAYAVRHAAGAASAKRRLDNTLSGVEQVQFIRKLSEMSDDQLVSEIVPQLKEIASIVATKEGITGGVTFTPGNENLKHNQSLFEDLVGGLSSSSPIEPISDIAPLPFSKTHYELPFGISFAGVAVKGVSYTHPDSAALRILCSLLTYRHLHQEIREKGGAYGGGASYSALDGVVSFYSYRDPHPVNTVNTISKAGEWAAQKQFTENELESAKLTVFQGLDSPISPRSEIAFEYLHGLTNEIRNQARHELLSVTLQDVKRVAEKYLVPALKEDLVGASATVLGPAQEEFKSWNVIKS